MKHICTFSYNFLGCIESFVKKLSYCLIRELDIIFMEPKSHNLAYLSQD